jgi:hypothetical protein
MRSLGLVSVFTWIEVHFIIVFRSRWKISHWFFDFELHFELWKMKRSFSFNTRALRSLVFAMW